MDDLMDEILEWSYEEDPNKVDQWLDFAEKYMKEWDWNDIAIKDFLNWGEYGFNNKLLHFETSIESFYLEVQYCSDRMSIDRLFRCHVKYRTLNKNGYIL